MKNCLMILTSVKIWDINMFSQFSSKESAHCWLIFLQNFFYKKGFYPKNLRDLWPKIFEASKILRQFEMDRRQRRRWIFGEKSSKNEDLRSFVATLTEIGVKEFGDLDGVTMYFDKEVEITRTELQIGSKTLITRFGGIIGVSKNLLWIVIFGFSSVGFIFSKISNRTNPETDGDWKQEL